MWQKLTRCYMYKQVIKYRFHEESSETLHILFFYSRVWKLCRFFTIYEPQMSIKKKEKKKEKRNTWRGCFQLNWQENWRSVLQLHLLVLWHYSLRTFFEFCLIDHCFNIAPVYDCRRARLYFLRPSFFFSFQLISLICMHVFLRFRTACRKLWDWPRKYIFHFSN